MSRDQFEWDAPHPPSRHCMCHSCVPSFLDGEPSERLMFMALNYAEKFADHYSDGWKDFQNKLLAGIDAELDKTYAEGRADERAASHVDELVAALTSCWELGIDETLVPMISSVLAKVRGESGK